MHAESGDLGRLYSWESARMFYLQQSIPIVVFGLLAHIQSACETQTCLDLIDNGDTALPAASGNGLCHENLQQNLQGKQLSHRLKESTYSATYSIYIYIFRCVELGIYLSPIMTALWWYFFMLHRNFPHHLGATFARKRVLAHQRMRKNRCMA